jgi:hypothetical protein
MLVTKVISKSNVEFVAVQALIFQEKLIGYLLLSTVLSEMLDSHVCGGSKIAKFKKFSRGGT